MFHYRVKNMEPFKDGNVLGGRFIKPGEILIVSEDDKNRMAQSGAVLEVIEALVPNPLKAVKVEPVEEIKEEVKPVEAAQVVEEVVPAEEPVAAEEPVVVAPRKRGRPRKNA